MAQPSAVRHHVLPDELLVVTVSGLAIDLKLDALVHAIDAVDRLADRYPVRLVVIGDGEARDALVEED
jgi:L-malate glycosyltransferase